MSFDLKLYNGDVVIGNNNDLQKAEGTDKLIQDIIKIISTPIGGNVFFPWYGCPITKSLVGRSFDRQFISSIATQQARSSLERLQTLQTDQLRMNQVVTPEEQMAALQKVIVDRDIQDPRFYNIGLTVLTKAFSRVVIPLSVQL